MSLMQLILSYEAMKSGLAAASRKFLIGTVEGDIHDIGKSIVGGTLTAEGFDIVDIGVYIRDKVFVERTKDVQPDILSLSALTTTRIRR